MSSERGTMESFDERLLCDLSARVVFFPVRHHSPASSRVLGMLARELRPSAILVECPSDYNSRLDELTLPHQPPIALYSYVRLEDDRRTGAFYPFCEHSPEWQAVQVAREVGAVLRFIDLPWADIAATDVEETSNRFTDAAFRRSAYIVELCRKLGLEDFHALWDTLFEIDPGLDVATYLRRAHELCGHMRLLEGEGRLSDRRREAFMASQIRESLARYSGPILVVVGGAHCLPLWARIHGHDLGRMTEPAEYEPRAVEADEERGLSLTPYSFERLDGLAGYEAGMPNPGFYQQIWHDRQEGRADSHRQLLARVVERLRELKQQVSAADLIAVESTAVALASLRGHPCVWRTDLVDALTTSLVKEQLNRAGRHPLLEAIHGVLRGGARGTIASGTLLPPLVRDIQEQLRQHGLETRSAPREVELVLESAADRPRSRVLHCLRLLNISGFAQTGGTDLSSGEAMVSIWERWRISWSPNFEAHAIEAARYGPTLAEATAAVLAEQAGLIERDAGAAAALLLDAALAGLVELAWSLRQRVEELIRIEGDFFNLTGALEQLLFLYRYDHVLDTAGSESMGSLLREVYDRALWLLESLGDTGGRDREAIQGMLALRETFERCELPLNLDRGELAELLGRIAGDAAQSVAVRGAALGGQWSLGATDSDHVRAQFRQFVDPEQLGDYLGGLFALAREQVQRRRELILALHEIVVGWSREEFYRAIPAMRLAFTYFTPREKHHLAVTLREGLGLGEMPEMAALRVDAVAAEQAMQFEDRLYALAARYGVRGS